VPFPELGVDIVDGACCWAVLVHVVVLW
jgi:hypothetical protein